ncbi:hypothetical protein ACP275_02G088500 [Erythranthe tilingii]
MKSSNHLILSFVFLMVLVFINDIGSANATEENQEKFLIRVSKTYTGLCALPKCVSTCKSEGLLEGQCAPLGKRLVCLCSDFHRI